MNQLDYVREEMAKRKCTNQQINSNAVGIILDIISNSGDKYTELQKEEGKATKKLSELRKRISQNLDVIEKQRREMASDKEVAKIAEDHRIHCEDYIDEFNKSLRECETPEARDKLRMAQLFANSVTVNNKATNTAYIIGVASILGCGNASSEAGVKAIEALQKVEKRLRSERNFTFDWFDDPEGEYAYEYDL